MSLVVQIAAEFTGAKAFKTATKQTSSLEKGVKKLGKSLGIALSTAAVVNFGKSAAKAFLEDEKSAARLAKVVDNLGLSFANPVIEGFIDRLTLASGVADDKLRPAFQALLTTTGDVIQSQGLLQNAIDISAGSGVELTTVAQDLANAYVGNTKGLKKYNLGLTQQQLKTKSFTEIQKLMNAQFAGSNQAYLETYAGKMQLINTAANEAKETIGQGLVDALMELTGNTSVTDLATDMQGFADSISNALVGLGTLIGKLKSGLEGAKTSGWLNGVLGNVDWIPSIGSSLAKIGERKKNQKLQNPSVQMFMTDQANNRLNNKKANNDKKNSDKQSAAMKANTAELKKQALIKKQNSLFDLQQIGLVAALKGKLTEDERDKIKLQLALLQGNDAEAAKLSQKIANSIDSTGKLAQYLRTLPDANNPFKGWDAWLKTFKADVATIGFGTDSSSKLPVPPSKPQVPDMGGGGKTDVTVNITALGQITTQQDITEAIRNGLLDAGMSGLAVANVRRLGSFGG